MRSRSHAVLAKARPHRDIEPHTRPLRPHQAHSNPGEHRIDRTGPTPRQKRGRASPQRRRKGNNDGTTPQVPFHPHCPT
ncbi:hypothetical protein SBD_2023 [Streptomyces bottropensis ATCC 25435]|uniref:Uncharacterized protein n=1 Tax=Streptomyces bottropensis ATCC 25435 TaxID=1054862 RepID=M3FWW8_9ACTN|nr:hypothetical protein SBD_2023 [Streptomyces bottropensis ATCC 25435]